MPAVRTGTEIHRGGKRGNTKGVTAPYCPVHPPDTVLQHCSQPGHCLRAALTISGGTGGPSCPPHPPPATQRGLSRAPRSPGGCWCPRGPRHFWSASASLWEEGRERGRGSGPLREPGGRRQPREWPLSPGQHRPPAAPPELDSAHPRSRRPCRQGSQLPGALGARCHGRTGSMRGGRTPSPLPWCCRDLSPSRAWLCSSSRCGGRVLGKKTLSGHSSPGLYCTLSRLSFSALAEPAKAERGLRGQIPAGQQPPDPQRGRMQPLSPPREPRAARPIDALESGCLGCRSCSVPSPPAAQSWGLALPPQHLPPLQHLP